MKTNNFAFQGVNGAYSEQAGKNVFPDAKSVPCATFEEMFACVKNDKADIALVPIENSQAGRVADTQRLIPDSDLNIIGEYFLEVRHNLLVIPGTKINDIAPTQGNILTHLVFIVRSIPASIYKCLGGFASNRVNNTK